MNPYSTWTDLKHIDLALFPIGSLEQHGYHLPINTDSLIAEAIANQLAKTLTHRSFVIPNLPFSASFEHAHFPGSISLCSETIIHVVKDVIHSLERMGITKCVIVNGHGGNMLFGNIAQEMNVNSPKLLITPSRKHWDRAYEKANLSTTISRDMHAGEGEASILLSLLQEGTIKTDHYQDVDSPRRDLFQVLGIKPYSKTGAIGFPTRASAEKGKALLHALTDEIKLTVEDFLKLGS
ncbi:creatininase family protein [Hazenella sp. IB182357]|uniref:Creatininase family protein n=1 Tax=Polycladospora coralii TaxID=2771432 RepID=A0A926N8R8_9BACL|nr:creatininase family protein [Polycladospora coralii]MBD1371887.1 creatininase family protein [Polycladospora coralii]MBS7529348.1 creatininase family protein [Polycladospora coralii]